MYELVIVTAGASEGDVGKADVGFACRLIRRVAVVADDATLDGDGEIGVDG